MYNGNMNNKTIIFDLDGTLLYTLEDLTDSVNFALNQFGYPTRSINEIKQFVGNGISKLIERAIPEGTNDPNFKECLYVFKKHYSENMYNKTKPYNGINELLIELKKQNFKIAVASNKFDTAVQELCKKYFQNLIDIAIGENTQIGINKKPAPDMVYNILEKLNSGSETVLYIGDSEVDIETAQNSNIKCISVTWGYKDEEFLLKHGAKFIARNPKDILEILKTFDNFNY